MLEAPWHLMAFIRKIFDSCSVWTGLNGEMVANLITMRTPRDSHDESETIKCGAYETE